MVRPYVPGTRVRTLRRDAPSAYVHVYVIARVRTLPLVVRTRVRTLRTRVSSGTPAGYYDIPVVGLAS